MNPSPILPFLTAPLLSVVLMAHQYQADSNNCGPYCTATVIQTLRHQEISGSQVAMDMNAIDWLAFPPVVSRIKNWATFPWGIKHYLKRYNISSHWKLFQKPESLISSLSFGNLPIVLIGELKPVWAHYMILISTHPELGFGFCDPAHPYPEIKWKEAAIFLEQWKNYGNTFIDVQAVD